MTNQDKSLKLGAGEGSFLDKLHKYDIKITTAAQDGLAVINADLSRRIEGVGQHVTILVRSAAVVGHKYDLSNSLGAVFLFIDYSESLAGKQIAADEGFFRLIARSDAGIRAEFAFTVAGQSYTSGKLDVKF